MPGFQQVPRCKERRQLGRALTKQVKSYIASHQVRHADTASPASVCASTSRRKSLNLTTKASPMRDAGSSLHPSPRAAEFGESVMRPWTFSAAIGAAILISSSGSASHAQAVVSGSYARASEGSDAAFQAIESAIAGVPDSKRPLARMRLRKSVATSRFRISSTGSRFSIKYDDKAPIVVWIGGDSIKWKLVESLVFDVSAKADGEAISLTFRGDDIERTTVYRSVGQHLEEDTAIISPILPTPIRYKVVYNRVN
jgi:hypothetical protein